MARAPYNTVVIPFIRENNDVKYCIMLRSDMENGWQFIAGGGEDAELPIEGARREMVEESEISKGHTLIQLKTFGYVPSFYFSQKAQFAWGSEVFVIPNYAFAVEVYDYNITLSEEHLEYKWLNYNEAIEILKFDSNKTALWELKCRIENNMISFNQ